MTRITAAVLGILVWAGAFADETQFSVLHTFDVADAVTGASPRGSRPDTRPVIGADGAVYGMTFTGGINGNGVIYRYDPESGKYSVLHTFGALDANRLNYDGAHPGVALTRGPDDVFYGTAGFGGTSWYRHNLQGNCFGSFHCVARIRRIGLEVAQQ